MVACRLLLETDKYSAKPTMRLLVYFAFVVLKAVQTIFAEGTPPGNYISFSPATIWKGFDYPENYACVLVIRIYVI